MLLLVMLPLLKIAADVPSERMAFAGRLAPAEVMTLLEIVLLRLPVVVPVEMNTVPTVTAVPEPAMVQLVMTLPEASATRRIVLAVAVALVLEMLSELPLA